MPFLSSVRSRFSSLFSKASEPASNPLPEWAYQTPRAGMSPWDQVSANNQRLSLNIAYRLEQEVSIFSDIALTLRQELFRNGVEWEQKFACKCALCGAEHDEFVPKCETCGSDNITKPNPAQKLHWGHADKTDFFLVANKTGQSFKDVLEDMEFNLDVADRCIALVLKYYGLDDDGNITEAVPLEILSLDPRFTRLIYDTNTGLPGGEGKICLLHRQDLQGEDKKTCKHCGKKLYEAIAKTEYPGHNEYYVEGEIFWTSKYFPKFGRPPVFAIIDDAWAYHYLEKRIRNYFEKGRPPSILEVPSTNVASVSTQMANMVANLNQNSDYFPWIATDPASHKGLSVVNLMNDPSPEMLEVKADIRLRFGSYFGVMPLFQGDVGSAGGLNNESRQLEVSNRAFTRGQAIFNDKFFPWLLNQFGITDWKLCLSPAEDADELADEQIISAQFDNMKKALDMGMNVEFRSGKVTYSGSPQKVQQLMPPLALDGSPAEQESGNPVPGENDEEPAPFEDGKPVEPDAATVEDNPTDEQLKQKSDPDLSSLSHEEYVDYISPKPFMKSSADYLIQALLKLQKWTEFEKLAPQEAEEVYRSIIGIMTKEDGWSLDMVSRDLKKRFPQLTDYDAERIARTETSAIANKARELDFKDSQPEDTLYYWGGPSDDRTSGVCREIKKILDGRGLPLEQLRALCNEVAIKYGLKPRDWVLHPNERHTIRIWYGDL